MNEGCDYAKLSKAIKEWGRALGFREVGIASLDLDEAAGEFRAWLEAGFHGSMGYMARNVEKRRDPALLHPGTVSIVSVRMDYLVETTPSWEVMADGELGFVSRYALGRDYHKVMRARLKKLAARIAEATGPFGHRLFVDSAPVLEKPLAARAGLGWAGKHTNLLARDGSWFFLGELFTDLPLPADDPVPPHCGRCTACIEICPTGAIVAPHRLDARRCISYLTIEHEGAIPEPLRPLMGNRIYGCDDCQLICPWNRFARTTDEADFLPRNGLEAPRLVELFLWSEEEFLRRLEGSPIRRIGHRRWLRNIAVALGNGPATAEAIGALRARLDHPDETVREHVRWALLRLAGG